MKIELKGEETIQTSRESLWNSVIDPEVLQRVIPGCYDRESEGQYIILLELKIAAVSGSFQGDISLRKWIHQHHALYTFLAMALSVPERACQDNNCPDEEKVAKISYEAKGM